MKIRWRALKEAIEDVILAEEIRDGRVAEVSGVDTPATGRAFTMFKSANGTKRSECVQSKIDEGMSEDEAEAACASSSYGKAEGADPEVFDRCVEGVIGQIESGDLVPEDPDVSPEEVGYAMCTASGAGKGMKMARKEVAPPAPTLGEVVALPTASIGETVDADDLTEIATEQGLNAEQADCVCKALFTDFPAPWDPNLVLVQRGMSPSTLVAGAAKALGYTATGPDVKLQGKSHWLDSVKRMFGVTERPGVDVLTKHIRTVEKRLEESVAENVKSRDDLRHVVDALIASQAADRRLMARALGLDLEDVEAAPATIPTAPAAAAPPAFAGVGKSAAGQKDDAGAGAPAPGAIADPAIEERIGRMEAVLAEIVQALGGGGAPAEEPPAAGKRFSQPDTPPARRFGVKAAGGGDMVHSTYFDMPMSRASREQARKAMGVPRYVSGR